MSVKAMSWAFGMKIEPVKKIILLSLADCADDHGKSCFPGYALLADKSSVCTKTIKRNINKLVDMGLITKTVRRNGKRFTSNAYELLLDVDEPKDIKAENDHSADEDKSKNAEINGDSESLPEQASEESEKNLPIDNESLPMDSSSPHLGTPDVPVSVTYPSLNTDSDTDGAREISKAVFQACDFDDCNGFIRAYAGYIERCESEGTKPQLVKYYRLFGFNGRYVQEAFKNHMEQNRSFFKAKEHCMMPELKAIMVRDFESFNQDAWEKALAVQPSAYCEPDKYRD